MITNITTCVSRIRNNFTINDCRHRIRRRYWRSMMTWEDRRSNWTKHTTDTRTDYDIDYGRIVHSASFRRLQGKTQILNLGDSDFYRTRLTHSLEVAQIAASISRHLKNSNQLKDAIRYLPESSLIQAISFCHDLGHPPFGHGGEIALNYCMRENGGFEGNGQTLRILSRLETYSRNHGADLTRRSLLGVLKYPAPFSKMQNKEKIPELIKNTSTIRIINRDLSTPPKCYFDSEHEVVEWIMLPFCESDRAHFQKFEEKISSHNKPIHKSLDCSLMDLADDIAYGIHDLEDVIALSLISQEDLTDILDKDTAKPFIDYLAQSQKNDLDSSFNQFIKGLFSESEKRKMFISRLVGFFIQNTIIEEIPLFKDPLLRYRITLNESNRNLLNKLQKVIKDKVITKTHVQHFEFKGQELVVSVFEAIASDPKKLLPETQRQKYLNSGEDIRIICDTISEMTDDGLMKTYERLFSPRMGSIFDRI